MPVPTEQVILRRRGPSGAWLDVRAEGTVVRGEAGITGNRLDPARLVRRCGWEIRNDPGGDPTAHPGRDRAGSTEVVATWPVREVITHRAGTFVLDLADDIVAAGGDVAHDLASVAEGVRVDPARPLAHGLLALAYPVLHHPVAQGAELTDVPIAVDLLLRQHDARAAATRLVGRRVTRPLVRSLAASLLPDDAGAVAFEPLLVALMASPFCGPEQITDLLGRRPVRVGAVAVGVEDVDRARVMFLGQPPRRVHRRLQSALDDQDGMADLVAEIGAWSPAPPPARRVEAPVPTATPMDTSPAEPGPDRCATPIIHPPSWAAARGAPVGVLHIVLPRCGNDVIAWGREMDNCLGSFRMAVADGRTRLLALAGADHRLHFVVEVTPAGTVRQLEGRANARPGPEVAAPILRRIGELGLAVADGRSNRPLGPPR